MEELNVIKKARKLAISTYNYTKRLPESEQYNLISQMQRASVSVASNLSEGQRRGSNKEFIRFVNIARGSLYELETQLHISLEVYNLVGCKESEELHTYIVEVGKMTYGLMKTLQGGSDSC